MAKIKIKDLPKGQKISKEEMKKVLGGTLTLNQERLTTSTVRIFRKPPTFMEKNDEGEHIFYGEEIR